MYVTIRAFDVMRFLAASSTCLGCLLAARSLAVPSRILTSKLTFFRSDSSWNVRQVCKHWHVSSTANQKWMNQKAIFPNAFIMSKQYPVVSEHVQYIPKVWSTINQFKDYLYAQIKSYFESNFEQSGRFCVKAAIKNNRLVKPEQEKRSSMSRSNLWQKPQTERVADDVTELIGEISERSTSIN